MSNNLKGVWIDGGVWECETLNLIEKHLIQKIKDLDNDKGCTAMNAWFADFLGVSKPRVSQLIKSLKDKKLISVKLKYQGKEVVGRVIRILKGGNKLFKGGDKKIKDPRSYIKDPSLENYKESNIVLSNRVKEYKEKEKNYKKEISLLREQLEQYKTDTPEDKEHDYIEEVKEILQFFMHTTGKTVRIGKSNSLIARSDKYKKILPRLRDGATVEECKSVISIKTKQWKGDKKMDSSLCIPTLFRASNFEKYLDECDNITGQHTDTSNYTPPYDLPQFIDDAQRYRYFLLRFNHYRPLLPDQSAANTTLRQRAVQKQDAERLCYELEQQQPELSKIQFAFKI